TTATSDVRPVTSTFTLASNPSGLSLTLDGQPLTAPGAITGVVRMRRTVGAPAQQVAGGRTYNFVSWSDGGAAVHDIDTPETNTTFTANYVEAQSGSTDVDVTTSTTGSSVDPD